MKKVIKETSKRLVYRFLGIVPRHILVKSHGGGMWQRVAQLASLPIGNIHTVVDIGAFDGLWARRFYHFFPTSKIFMIEPLANKSEALTQTANSIGGKYIKELLGGESGQKKQFLEFETGSSVLPLKSNLGLENIPSQTITAKSLDDVCLENQIGQIDLIKIDTQGSEFEIVRTSKKALQAKVIIAELSTYTMYAGAPNCSTLISFLYENGFVLYDIADVRRDGGGARLREFDGIFVQRKLLDENYV